MLLLFVGGLGNRAEREERRKATRPTRPSPARQDSATSARDEQDQQPSKETGVIHRSLPGFTGNLSADERSNRRRQRRTFRKNREAVAGCTRFCDFSTRSASVFRLFATTRGDVSDSMPSQQSLKVSIDDGHGNGCDTNSSAGRSASVHSECRPPGTQGLRDLRVFGKPQRSECSTEMSFNHCPKPSRDIDECVVVCCIATMAALR
jgi:hypothetical protein